MTQYSLSDFHQIDQGPFTVPPRPQGPFTVPPRLQGPVGCRETAILQSRDTAALWHRNCRDCDFYLHDGCITYSSPTLGHFDYDTTTGQIVG